MQGEVERAGRLRRRVWRYTPDAMAAFAKFVGGTTKQGEKEGRGVGVQRWRVRLLCRRNNLWAARVRDEEKKAT